MSAGRESMVWNHTEILYVHTVCRRAVVSQNVRQGFARHRPAQITGTRIAECSGGFSLHAQGARHDDEPTRPDARQACESTAAR